MEPEYHIPLAGFLLRGRAARLDDETLLFLIIEQFARLDLHPDRVPAHEMGNLFEELLRQCWHRRDFEGEYFTPPDLADLMVHLVHPDRGGPGQGRPATVYEPCCGTGRLLLAARDFGMSHSGVAVKARSGARFSKKTGWKRLLLCPKPCFITPGLSPIFGCYQLQSRVQAWQSPMHRRA